MSKRLFVIVGLLMSSFCLAETEGVTLEVLQGKVANNPAEGLLFFSQEERRVAFANIDQLYPTREVKAGSKPWPLKNAPHDFSALRYEHEGVSYSLNDFLEMTAHIGLIVVQDDDVLFEHYAEGNDQSTPWISFSVTKSVTSMLIGAAIKDGYIRSVEEPVAHYLPRLRGTPYETATIEDVLHMASGVSWNEDYANPDSDVAKAGGANGVQLVSYLAQLPLQRNPGEKFNYNTGETNLVGEILRSAIGNNAATYLTHKIWQPFGMGRDATWLLGSVGGGETGGCCINATLRDYARLGIFAMNEGVLPDGTQVLPEGWMKASTTPSSGADYYGYLWWLYGADTFAAQGIFEQQIFVTPKSRLVIAAHSNALTAVGSVYSKHLEALTFALEKSLR